MEWLGEGGMKVLPLLFKTKSITITKSNECQSLKKVFPDQPKQAEKRVLKT
jgi:hypothetical protein